ncbi:glycosyl hydrolase family 28-related protein [Enterobacter roggenkampii]|uniref:tail fiber/spike domain-containing protein n=1 Tax=Enterobacter roggenkampii TaxID=1812935 RepID=UPI0024475CDA|nr:glycosyl hydrolase family 28-related protein [Enterobacter roggenkampii]WGG56827.1 glycosyl hydrolase family 28-related protein [Enterobacter roggenkampii]
MTTYATNNPLGSTDPRDLYDNAQNFDHLSIDQVNETWDDRTGKPRLTWYGMEERYKIALTNLGWNPVGTFQGGAVVNSAGDIVQDTSDLTWYRWDNLTTLPKTVPSGSTPSSTGGTGKGKWQPVDVSDVLRRQISDPDGATKYPELQIARWRDEGDIRGWGCKCDGVTNDTVNFQNAINDNKSSGKPCIVPEGTTLVGPLTLYSKTTIMGHGQERTKLKLLAGSINALLYGANSDALWGTNSLLGEDGIIIENLTIDSDKANSPNGSGIAIYGPRTRIDKVNIINSGKNGLRTEWADSGNPDGGMEGSFSKIVIDKSGGDGWRFAGPHDSVVNDVIIISSGQKTASTYSGLWIEKGNARWSGIHCWTSASDLRSKYALKVSRPAEGNEFNTSHFEGADTNVFVEANNFTLSESCKVYYPWAGSNIVLLGSNPRISCYIGEEYKGIGLPLSTGITFGGGYGGVSGAVIDVIANGQDQNAVYFGDSAGYNSIRVRGYSTSTTPTALDGTPHSTDDIDITISGGYSQVVRKVVKASNLPVASITGTGGGQSGAAGYGVTAGCVVVNATGPGTGAKLPSTTDVGAGYSVQIANVSANTINIYPTLGQQILGLGVNTPHPLPALSSAVFTVSDSTGGNWIIIKGA